MNQSLSRSFAELVGFPATTVTGSLTTEVHGTTVLALRNADGVLMLADRRATMGNLVMYDHAEKILPLDDGTLVAISGSFARSIEVCRFLKHSFKYYSRMHLQEISMEGKLQEITRALAQNMPMAMQGIGVFVPILAAYDKSTNDFGIYFFDGAGARFENNEYACAGSGSERIRGVFEYLVRMHGPWHKRSLPDVLVDGMRMLDIAADLDSATGGFAKVLPSARLLQRGTNRAIADSELLSAAAKVLKQRTESK